MLAVLTTETRGSGSVSAELVHEPAPAQKAFAGGVIVAVLITAPFVAAAMVADTAMVMLPLPATLNVVATLPVPLDGEQPPQAQPVIVRPAGAISDSVTPVAAVGELLTTRSE